MEDLNKWDNFAEQKDEYCQLDQRRHERPKNSEHRPLVEGRKVPPRKMTYQVEMVCQRIHLYVISQAILLETSLLAEVQPHNLHSTHFPRTADIVGILPDIKLHTAVAKMSLPYSRQVCYNYFESRGGLCNGNSIGAKIE
jgi:hypothetical protein